MAHFLPRKTELSFQPKKKQKAKAIHLIVSVLNKRLYFIYNGKGFSFPLFLCLKLSMATYNSVAVNTGEVF